MNAAMQVIYTHVGSILVAVNPFEKLDIYSAAEVTIS
jgi:myosin heavy subunit